MSFLFNFNEKYLIKNSPQLEMYILPHCVLTQIGHVNHSEYEFLEIDIYMIGDHQLNSLVFEDLHMQLRFHCQL